MRRFRFWVGILLLASALFFNIERLDVGAANNVVDIQTFTYFLATAAIISVLTGVPFRHSTVGFALTVWLVFYCILKLFVFHDRPFWGGSNSYVAITEMAFLAILILLAHQVKKSLEEIEESVQDIALANGQGLHTLEGATETIRMEWSRSRHYNRQLSTILVDVKPTPMQIRQLIDEMQETFVQRYAIARVAKEIRSQLRDTDQVFLGNTPNQIVVLCPETNREDSEMIFSRIEPWVALRAGAKIEYGIATFPEDGITLNSLLDFADNHRNGGTKEPSDQPFDGSSYTSISNAGTD